MKILDIWKFTYLHCGRKMKLGDPRGSPNFIFLPQCKYVNFQISKIFIHLDVYLDPIHWPAPSWLVSSIGRALHRYRRGHGFKSRTGLKISSGPIYSRLYVAVHLFSYGSPMTLEYGKNKKVTDVSNNAIHTIQANYKSICTQVLLPPFPATFNKFQGFPFWWRHNVKVSFWLFRERKEYKLTLTGSIAKSTEHKHNSS